MDPSPTDPSIFEWLISGIVGIGGAIGGFLFKDAYRRIDVATTKAEAGDKALWDAHNFERNSIQAFREDTIKTVGLLPTKSDIESMEARLMAAIARHRSGE